MICIPSFFFTPVLPQLYSNNANVCNTGDNILAVLTEHQLGLGVQGTGAWTAMTPVNIPLMVVFCQSNMPALIN